MTSREALSEVDSILCDYKCRLKPDNCLYCEDNGEDELLDIIGRDINLVETLKIVLSKVTRVVYQPTMSIEYNIGEEFDVEAFKDIIDQLGYKLVSKEESASYIIHVRKNPGDYFGEESIIVGTLDDLKKTFDDKIVSGEICSYKIIKKED